MAAIISGNSLGLSLASLATLGQRGTQGTAGQGRNGEQAFVNIANGNLVLQDFDDKLVGRGLDIQAVRTYNSQGLLNDDNADNWIVGAYGQRVQLAGTVAVAGSTLTRTDRDGASATYTWDVARSLYVSPAGAGAFDTIAYDSAALRFTWTDGSTGLLERYESTGQGRLLLASDPAGNTLTYAYNTNGTLQSMVDANGETAYFDYTGTNLTQIRTVASAANGGTVLTRVRYAYDSANRLSTVTVDLSPEDNSIADGQTYVTTYTYDGTSKRVASVTQKDGTSLAFTYVLVGADYRVATVKDGLGQTTSYTYDTTARSTTVTDPLGLVSVYSYDAAGQLTQIKAPPVGGVSQLTLFSYDASGNVTLVTDPQGFAVTMQYDAYGNQTLQRDAAGNTVTRTFDARNQLLTETVYLAPDPDGAGTAQPSQPVTTRYVYDSTGKNRLRFVLSPEGRVTEYRYDSYGQRTSALQYAAGKYDVSALGTTAAPTEAVLATWSAAQDRTQASRTDTVYDARGQVQKNTVFSKVDAAGNGIADGSQSVTQYVYDRAGLLLSSISATAGTTQYTYDGKGRQLSAQNALSQTTLTSYDDANNKTVVTLASGLTTTNAYDKNGRLVSVTQGSALNANLGTTTYTYDKNNRLYQQTDQQTNPTGVRIGRLYDEAGRLVGEITSTARLTEYVYDKNNQLTQKIVYAIPVNATVLAAYFTDPNAAPVNRLAALRPTKDPADQKSWRIYDGAGRLMRTVDGMGAIVDMRYDGASRLVGTTSYKNPLGATLANLSAAPTLDDTAPTIDPASDRVTRRFYDNDGFLLGILDAEGYLTESRYDAQGRLVTQIAYASPADASLRAAGTLAQLINSAAKPETVAQNQTSRWLYDAQDRIVGQIDAEGFLTENVYDAGGNITTARRYATPLSATVLGQITTATTLASLRDAAGTNTADRTTTSVYDKLNRITQRTNFEGTVTQYVYDKVGNIVTTTSAMGTADVRVVNARYDIQGRLVGELTGVGSALLVAGQTQAQIDTIWTQYGVTHAYDAAGRRISTTDGYGYKTLFFYDAGGRLTHTINALGEVTERQYDTLGQLSATIEYGTRLASLTGLTGGLVSTALTTAVNGIRNATLDSKQSFTYTARGQLSSSRDAIGNGTISSYNAFGELTNRTQDLGGGAQRVQTLILDRRGLVTGTVTDASGVNAITSAVYDAFGRLTRSTDANGNVLQQSYDRLGRATSTTDALNAVRSTNYDAFDRVLTQTDALGLVTSYVYDNVLRTVTVKTPENISVKTTFTRQGQKLSVVDGNGVTTSFAYDKNGNLLSTTNALATTTSTYDRTNRLFQTKDARGTIVELAYDAANRLLTRTVDKTGLNLVTTYAYDPKGRQFSVTDPNGTLTKITYDLKGQVIRKEVDPTGLKLITQYTYDGEGNTLTVVDPNGTTTQYVYDKVGRRTQERVDPAGLNLTRSYVYDKNGNVTSSTDANGQVTRYVYDAEDRLVYTLDPAAGLQRIRYDVEGRVIQTTRYATAINLTGLPAAPAALTIAQLDAKVPAVVAGDSIEHRVLDKDGRLVASVNGLGEVVKFVYDANGNVIERRAFATPIALASWTVGTVPTPTAIDARDQRLRTVYDGLNRAIYTLDGVGAVTRNVYDANGNVIERNAYSATVPVGTAATAAALSAAIAPLTNAARDIREVMVYDRANRLSASTDGMGTVTQRTYDKNGNVTSISYSASGPNLLTQSEFANGVSDLQVRAGALTASSMAGYAGALKVDASATTATTAYKQLTTTPGATYTLSMIVQMDDGQPPSFGSSTFKDATNSFVLVMVNAARNPQQYVVQDLGGGRYRVSVTAVSGGTYTGFGIVKYIENDSRGFRVTGYQLEQASVSGSYTPTGSTTVAAGAAFSTTRYAYDAAGRLVFTVGPQGQVEKNTFDAIGRATLVTRYAKAISTSGLAAAPTVAQLDALTQANTNLFTQSEFANGLSDVQAKAGPVSVATMTGFAGAMRIGADPSVPYTYVYKMLAARPGTTYTLSVVVEMEDGQPPSFVNASASSAANSFGLALFNGATNPTTYVVQDMGNGRYRVSVTGVAPASPPLGFGAIKYAGNDARAFRVSGYQLEQTAAAGTYVPTTTSATNAKDQQQHSVYDKAGRLVASVDALGSVVKYTRDANGNVTEKRAYYNVINLTTWVPGTVPAPTGDDARDQRTRTFFDAEGREQLSVDALGNVQQNQYDANGRLTRVTRYPKPVPAATANTYPALLDAAGAQASAAGLPAQVTVMVYDAAGRRVSQTSAFGRPEAATTVHAYDGLGQLTKTVEARGVELSQSDTIWALVQRQQLGMVNAAGGGLLQVNLTQAQRDALAARYTTTHAYDAAGRRISTTDPLGGMTQSSYDANGNVVKITDPRANSAFYYFDAAGRVTLSVDPEGYATATTYNTLGKTLSVKRYFNRVTGTYTTTQKPALPVANASDALTQFTYDVSGRLLRTTDAENRFESYTYNALGQRETFTNKLGGVTTYAYDRLGRVVSETLPITSKNASAQSVAVVNRSVYDAFGNKITSTEAVGLPEQRITQYTYDGLNRQLTVRQAQVSVYTSAGGWTTAAPTRTSTYDANGNLIVTVDPNGGRTRSWFDANNRKTAEVSATGTLSTWEYDAAGNVLALRVYGDRVALPAGDALPVPVDANNLRKTTYRVDANNRVLSSTVANLYFGSRNEQTGQYEIGYGDIVQESVYDANGQVVRQKNGAGALTYTWYDKLGEKVLEIDPLGYAVRWERDANGAVLRETRFAKPLPVTDLDLLSESNVMTAVLAKIPEPNAAGNRVTQYTYDRNARVLSESRLNVAHGSVNTSGALTEGSATATRRFGYDAMGNQTSITDALNQRTDLTYDLLGRLLKEQKPTAANEAGAQVRQTTEYEYDGLDNVRREIRRGTNAAAETDDQIVRYGYDATGVRTSMITAKGETFTYGRDANGNTTAQLVDRADADGAVTREIVSIAYNADNRETSRFTGTRDAANAPVYDIAKTVSISYNAYGQMAGRRTGAGNSAGTAQEYFDYDAGGRLWRTNSQDGINKAWFYDLAGNATLLMQSQTLDLRSMTMSTLVGRTDILQTITAYDKRNQAVSVTQPKVTASRPNLVMVATALSVDSGQFGGLNLTVGSSQGTNYTSSITPPARTDAVGRGAQLGSVALIGTGSYRRNENMEQVLDLKQMLFGSAELSANYQALYGNIPTWKIVVQGPNGAAPVVRYAEGGGAWPKWLFDFGSYLSADLVNTNVSISAITGSGKEVLVGFTSAKLLVDYGLVPNFPTGTFLRLSEGEIPGDATVQLYHRAPGSTGPFQQSLPIFKAGEGGSSLNNVAVDGWLMTRLDGWGPTELLFVVTRPDGTVLRRDSIQWSPPNGASYSVGQPKPVFTSDGVGHFTGLQTSSGVRPASIRVSQRPWGSTGAYSATHHGAAGTGRFDVGFAAGARDVLIEMLNGSGAVIDSLRGRIDTGASVYDMQFVRELPSTVTFQGIPTSAKTLTIDYVPVGPGKPAGSVTLTRVPGSSTFVWDTQDAGLIPDFRNLYSYTIKFVARDTDGFKVTDASGAITVGAVTQGTSATLTGSNKPQVLTFDPGIAGGQTLKLRYREKGAGTQQLPLYGPPVVMNKNADGTLIFGEGYTGDVVGFDPFGKPVYGNVRAVTLYTYTQEIVTTADPNAGGTPIVTGYEVPYYGIIIGVGQDAIVYARTRADIDAAIARAGPGAYEHEAILGFGGVQYIVYNASGVVDFRYTDDLYGSVGGLTVVGRDTPLPVYSYNSAGQQLYSLTVTVAHPIYPEDPAHFVIGEQSLDFLEVSSTRTESGSFKWDATASNLSPNKEYEYLYDVYNAAGVVVGSGEGYFRPDNSGTNDAANVRIQWVIPNLPGGTSVPGEPSEISGTWQIQRRQTYDAFGQVVSETDGNGNLMSLTYNALGQLIDKVAPATSITLANGQVQTVTPTEHYSYNLNGQLVGKRDANGNQSTAEINAAGQAVAEWHPGAAGGSVAVRKAYDVFGNLRTVTDEIGRVTNNSYDLNNRLVRVDRPINADGSRAFDVYQYDALGQRIAHQNALGFRERTYYDSMGRVIRYVSAEGRTVNYAFTYDQTIGSVGGVNTGGWVYTTTDATGRVQTLKNDVFGRTMWKQDLGGHEFTYAYNWSGLIASQTGTSGQNITYSYYANGYLRQVIDVGTLTESLFEYDNNGNRTFEGYKSTAGSAAMVFQQSYVTYDAFNRVRKIEDGRYTIEYEYDANGNRRRVHSIYNDGVSGVRATQDYWYQYDGMNRFTVTMGQLVNGQVVRGSSGDGVTIEYDNAGQRKAATYASDGHREDYAYDGTGNLTTMTLNGVLRARRTNDLAGRVTLYEELNENQTLRQSQKRTWDKDNMLTREDDNVGLGYTTYARLQDGTLAETMTWTPEGTNLTALKTMYAYEWWDVAKQTAITTQAASTGTPAGTQWKPGYSRFAYDVNGHVKAANDPYGNRTFTYWTNAEGQVLQRDEYMGGTFLPTGLGGGAQKNRTHHYFYFDGKRVGNVGNDGTEREDYAQQLARDPASAQGVDSKYRKFTPTNSADFDENYQPINAGYPAAAPGSYTVRPGDTLEGIARAVWGDAMLWYLIAEANGIDGQPSAPLVANTVLTIPNRVTNVHNTSDTFRPYDPGKAIGDTSPTLPNPLPPPGGAGGGGCGGLGQIIVAVVAVVAAFWTAGTSLGYLAPGGATVGGVGLGTAGGLATGIGMVTGSVAGVGWGAMAAAAAVGGAAGSVAGQIVGMGLGVQDSFSWKGVAMGALGAGVAAGVGSWLGQGGGLGGLLSADTPIALAGRMVVGSAVGQGLGVATGLQQRFDWRGVAASAASGFVSAWAGSALQPYLGNVGSALASRVAGSAVGTAVRGTSVSKALPSIVADALGSTVGNALGDSIAAANSSVPGPVGADERSRILGYFADGPGTDAERNYANYQQVVDAFSQDSSGQRYAGTQYADASGSRRAGVVSDAGEGNITNDPHIQRMLALANEPESIGESLPKFRVEVRGVGSTLSEAQKEALNRGYGPLTDTAAQARLLGDGDTWGMATALNVMANAPATGSQAGALLPSVENLYTPMEGFFQGRYKMATQGMTDPGASLVDRGVYFALAMGVSPFAALETPITALYNAPNNAGRAGQNLARADLTTDSDVAVMSRLAATAELADAFVGLGGPATLMQPKPSSGMPGPRTGPLADDMLADGELLTNRASGKVEWRSLSDEILAGPSSQAWGVLSNGTNQGLKHFVDYWTKYPERIPSLETRLGLEEGAFAKTTGGFDAFTAQAQRVVGAGEARLLSESKSAHFLSGAQSANKGVVVIVQDGKLQSMMPSDPRSFSKLR